MNKTKAKGLIKKLRKIDGLVGEVIEELNYDHLLYYVYDYTGITRDELRKKYHIKESKT